MTDIVSSSTVELVKTSKIPELLNEIRPAWQAKDLINRVRRLISVDPSSACQRLFNASIHDLREKIVIAGIDIAGEAAKQYNLPPVVRNEDVENYPTSKIIDLAYQMGILSRPDWRRLSRCYEIRRDLEHEDDEYEAGVEDIEIIRKAFEKDEFEHLIEFYILTGSRLQEPLSLTWDDVDFRRERIVIKGENTKAKRNRIIDFKDDDKLKKLLGNIPKRSDNRLFGLPNVEKQWSRFWVGEKIRKILGELGFPWASCKTFRHSFISHLVMSGVPLLTVQELVGHATYSTTLQYSHLAQTHKGAMIKKRPY